MGLCRASRLSYPRGDQASVPSGTLQRPEPPQLWSVQQLIHLGECLIRPVNCNAEPVLWHGSKYGPAKSALSARRSALRRICGQADFLIAARQRPPGCPPLALRCIARPKYSALGLFLWHANIGPMHKTRPEAQSALRRCFSNPSASRLDESWRSSPLPGPVRFYSISSHQQIRTISSPMPIHQP